MQPGSQPMRDSIWSLAGDLGARVGAGLAGAVVTGLVRGGGDSDVFAFVGGNEFLGFAGRTAEGGFGAGQGRCTLPVVVCGVGHAPRIRAEHGAFHASKAL